MYILYVYIYIYIFIYLFIFIYMYMYMYRHTTIYQSVCVYKEYKCKYKCMNR